MARVELVAVQRADAVDQLHLERDNRHRRHRVGQQLEGAIQDGVVQDHAVLLLGRHRAGPFGRRIGNAGHDDGERRRGQGLGSHGEGLGEESPAAWRPSRDSRAARKVRSAGLMTPSASHTPTHSS